MSHTIKTPGGFKLSVGDRVLSPTLNGDLKMPGIVVSAPTHKLWVIVCQPTVGSLDVYHNPGAVELDPDPQPIEGLFHVGQALAAYAARLPDDV